MQLLNHNISIKRRLNLIIMAISTISVLLTTMTVSLVGIYNIRNSIINELNLSATIVGEANISALEFSIYDKVPASMNVFSVKPQIVLACIYDAESSFADADDNILMDKRVGEYSFGDGYPSNCPEDVSPRITISDDHIEIMKDIVNDSFQRVGSIYIKSTLEQINEYIKKQFAIAITVIATALLLSYLLAVSLQRAISAPILGLAETARKISQLKDYAIRAPVIGDPRKEDKNELVVLTTAFNDMLTEIGERDNQLKKQNIALEKAKDSAESASRAKSQFLANISHELRTPLNAIIGFSSILMNQLFGPLGDNKYLEYAKDINESGTHLLDIINDILDLSKAEAGKLSITYQEVHVGKSINKCLTILAERAEKGNVTVSVDVPKTLPALIADRLRFIQIVLNIMSNAVKFTEAGGRVHVAAKVVDDQFVITVQDTGIGMSKEDLDKAFQSFGQVDSGLNRKYEGTGLGLPLTRKLIELHYGKIEMESELGKGTIVRLIFPTIPPPEAGYVAEE
ncbi:MAG: HAMP domain-containing histidine kinase [Rickettsiales bacterium]|jgi:signal transduction histidine kinase|nr:HAMP domain-containing histidine kinase [Rickettsiales bacterium]